MTDVPAEPLTAYPATERAYRAAMATRHVDHAAFERPITRCDLARCRGSCCATGVALNDESIHVIERLVEREREWFASIGHPLPEHVIGRPAAAVERGFARTALVPHQFRGSVEGFPAHFPDAACVFLLNDGRCSLQALAMARGKHPWYYKPTPCWLHPIVLSDDAVTVPDERTDRLPDIEDEGFTTETFCGRTEPCGRPAREVLREEIDFLSRIAGRDLGAELDQA
jgi:hypothetical protein